MAMRRSTLLAVLAALCTFLAACTSTRHAEEITPPGDPLPLR